MPKLSRVTSEEMIRSLRHAVFVDDHQTGSHLNMRDENGRRVVVARHGKTLGVGLTRALVKQAELSVERFIALLK